MTRAEEFARQGLLKHVATLAGAIAAGMTARELFSMLDVELQALAPRREAFERAEAEAWLEQQARTLKPRRPRITKAVWSRAAHGDAEALALIDARYRRPRRGKQLELVS